MAKEDLILSELQEIKNLATLQAKDALDMDDVCMLTGLSKQYIYTLIWKKQIPYYKSANGKRTYFRKSEINDWLLCFKFDSVSESEAKAEEMMKGIVK